MAAKKATPKKNDAVDWKKLRHAQGPAAKVPKQIADLTSGSDETRDAALSTLQGTLHAPGQWFSASEPTVSLLCDVLEGSAAHRHTAGWLLADVLAGGHLDALRRGGSLPEAAAGVHAAVAERAAGVLAALESDDACVRSSVAFALAFAPGLRETSVPALRKRAARETDESARASMLLALGVLGRDSKSAEDRALFDRAREGGAPDLVRGAAAVALLLLDSSRAPSELAADLAAFARSEPSIASFGWGDRLPLRLLGAVLGSKGLDTLVTLDLGDASARVWKAFAEALMQAGGFKESWQQRDVALPEELSPLQRKIAEQLAKRDRIPGIGWGIPESGRVRRRWLGLVPPGPLEKRVDGVPLWKLWKTDYAKAADGIPQLVRDQLSPVELAEAVAEVDLLAYRIKPGSGHLPKPLMILELAEQIGAAAADWAERFGREMRPYYDGTMGPEVAESLTPGAFLFLVIVPLLRAGRSIPDELAIFTPPLPPKLTRETLEKLSPAAREPVVFGWVSVGGASSETNIDKVLPLLDLAPSRRIASALASKLLHEYVRRTLGESVADAKLAEIEAIAARVPEVAAGLAEARKNAAS